VGRRCRSVTADDFTINPYNGTIRENTGPPVPQDNTNPLKGLPAFTGADEGSNKGSWGQSQMRIPGLFFPGDEVELDFVVGVDGCNGLDGWYIDDVDVHSCGEGLALEDQYFAADFTGDGRYEFGTRRGNDLSMYRPTGEVGFMIRFGNGNAESQYLFGDVNGDGNADLVVRRNNRVLASIDFDGQHDLELTIGPGNLADEYFLGDFDATGNDNFGVRVGNTIQMYEPDGDIRKEFNYGNGNSEDQYLVGDWNGDGRDDWAVRRGTDVFMNFNYDETHDLLVSFPEASASDEFIAGDWNGDGTDTIAVRSGRTIKLDVNGDGILDAEGDFGNGK